MEVIKILTDETIEIIRVCLKTMSAFGNDKSKNDTRLALDEFNDLVNEWNKNKQINKLQDQINKLEQEIISIKNKMPNSIFY